MLIWLVAVAGGVALAFLTYVWRSGWRSGFALPAALRFLTIAFAIALLLDAPAGLRRPVRPMTALDVSQSWLRARDSTSWITARRQAQSLGGDSLLLLGDSVRVAKAPAMPSDASTRVRPLVERALAAGRPLRLLTDGEADDPTSLEGLPVGSSVTVLGTGGRTDVAVTDLQTARAVIAGDTIDVRVTLGAGALGAGPGDLLIMLGGQRVDSAAIDSLAPYGERPLSRRVKVPAIGGPSLLFAIVRSRGDGEARNDTLTSVIDVSPAAGAVLVSTSPDYDARDALVVLRGALALPTRGFYRVAPGVWRVEGSLSPVPEGDVQRAVREAPLVILHGDTAIFGEPRSVTRGALALLLVPPDRGADWYATAAPASPLTAALTGVPWDSLPPLDVSDVPPHGDWEGLETRRSRRLERRVAIAGTERPRRTVVVTASGFWRWHFRGGASADAYNTLWGSLFDWLAAERSDVRAAAPSDGLVREGDRVRWRRGAGDDSVVSVVLRQRGGAARSDTITLRFAPGDNVAESAPQSAGIYDLQVKGGAAVLAVNVSREMLPRRPTLREGAVGRGASLADAPRLRSFGWPFVVVILALCAEWLLRRKQGMR